MINTTELRLGNWVNEIGKGYVQVESISQTSINSIFEGGEEMWHLAVDEVEPIPLTREILAKCGFDSCGNHIKLFGHLHPVFNQNGVWEYYNSDQSDNPQLTSLHQLQNLYFTLTGEELPFNPK